MSIAELIPTIIGAWTALSLLLGATVGLRRRALRRRRALGDPIAPVIPIRAGRRRVA